MKQLNRNKKKKGFTLIELVIVLAVLAIIALIAIPNFTRVRNESLINSDYRAAESIEKITLMAVANGDVIPVVGGIEFNVGDNGTLTPANAKIADLYREANGPQVPQGTKSKTFKVKVDDNGGVQISYTGGDVTFNNQKFGAALAGTNVVQPK